MTTGSSTPLHGARVVVTRAKAQASTLIAALSEAGAEPVEVATIKVVEPSDNGAALKRAVSGLAEFDWVVLTSTNAVHRYLAAIGDADQAATTDVRHAVVGSATLAALQSAAVPADLVPARFVAAALVEAFPSGPGRVLFPSAAVTAPTIVDGLTAKGWRVHQVEAYQTVGATITASQRHAVGGAHVALFTSASSVERFCELVGKDLLPPMVVAIGPSTEAAAEELGIAVTATADPHTIEGLMAALRRVWSTR